jgi:hypothetical protein
MAEYDVFVSYSKKDAPFVRSLTEALRERGVKVWYDSGELRVGENFMRRIEDALEQSRYFLLVISPEYLSSQWNSFELGVALSRDASSNGGHILPVLVRDAEVSSLPTPVSKYQVLNAKQLPVEQIAAKVAEVVKHE